ncbi:unnamed protein product, partial [Nesidiocoris tenuis]
AVRTLIWWPEGKMQGIATKNEINNNNNKMQGLGGAKDNIKRNFKIPKKIFLSRYMTKKICYFLRLSRTEKNAKNRFQLENPRDEYRWSILSNYRCFACDSRCFYHRWLRTDVSPLSIIEVEIRRILHPFLRSGRFFRKIRSPPHRRPVNSSKEGKGAHFNNGRRSLNRSGRYGSGKYTRGTNIPRRETSPLARNEQEVLRD